MLFPKQGLRLDRSGLSPGCAERNRHGPFPQAVGQVFELFRRTGIVLSGVNVEDEFVWPVISVSAAAPALVVRFHRPEETPVLEEESTSVVHAVDFAPRCHR